MTTTAYHLPRPSGLALILALAALLSAACAIEPNPPSGPAFAYSHTIGGLPETNECRTLRATCADVTLLCDGASAFSRECVDVAGVETDVYALPGAGDGKPFGVASCVELAQCEGVQ